MRTINTSSFYLSKWRYGLASVRALAEKQIGISWQADRFGLFQYGRCEQMIFGVSVGRWLENNPKDLPETHGLKLFKIIGTTSYVPVSALA